MSNDRGDLWVTFNGEIYNHLELRRRLEPRHAFASRSDTEVLLHLYEEMGEDMLPLLDGMFAFALPGPRGLLLARDPLGIKPLYYGRRGDLVLAASELKAFPPMDELHALPAGHFLILGEPNHSQRRIASTRGLLLPRACRTVHRGAPRGRRPLRRSGAAWNGPW